MSPDPQTRGTIVVAFSPETAAREPVEFGLAACRVTGAHLSIVAVRHADPMPRMTIDKDPELPADHQEVLRHLELDLKARGCHDVEISSIADTSTARGLRRSIEGLEPELVILGSTHRGTTGKLLMGDTAQRVIEEAHCPVAIVPNGYERPENGVQLIGAAFDPSDEGREALRFAAALARTGGVKLRAITVVHPKHAEADSHGLMAEQHHEVGPEVAKAHRGAKAMEAQLAAAVAEDAQGVDTELDVLVNEPADGLIAASGQLGLLVMGSRARGAHKSVLLGSVSRKVADGARCPVLVIPRGTQLQTGALLSDVEAQANITQPG